MSSLRPQDGKVLAALDDLLAALAEFRQAYDAWSQAPMGDTQTLRALLDEAERKVDAARAALEALERDMSG